MRIIVEVDDKDIETLWMAASRSGYIREDATKVWKTAEKVKAIRWFLSRQATGLINSEKARFS